MYTAGTTLKVNLGSYFHYGIADGLGGVIHNSKLHLQVKWSSYADFAEGRIQDISVSNITSESPSQAVIKANHYIGMPYNLIYSNCEHFVRLCHGLEAESTQIQKCALIAVGGGCAIKSDDPTIKLVGAAVAVVSLLTPLEESPIKNAMIVALLVGGLAALATRAEE